MRVKRIDQVSKMYQGTIAESIPAFCVSMEPQPDYVIPYVLCDYVPISLSIEGYLVGFEFIYLYEISKKLPKYHPTNVVYGIPAFEFNCSETYDWNCFRSEKAFVINMTQSSPDIEYRIGDISFYCLNDHLIAIEARNCELTEYAV